MASPLSSPSTAVAPTSGRSARARKVVNYAISSESSDEDDSEDTSDSYGSDAEPTTNRRKSSLKRKRSRTVDDEDSSGDEDDSGWGSEEDASKRSKAKKKSNTNKSLITKSPAEFFAENQTLAGFDNPGKALYTTVRELVENGLDAAEAASRLPDISVEVTLLSRESFREMRGLTDTSGARTDASLFAKKTKQRKKVKKSQDEVDEDGAGVVEEDEVDVLAEDSAMYFKVRVADNGCGLAHEDVPEAFGRVLTGSKYGVKQQRGKFGMGAKMALIWSKKSTGLPVKIETNNQQDQGDSVTELDLDIRRNAPNILRQFREPGTVSSRGGLGTTVTLVIAGAWATYKARLIEYMQQLAVITPYAQLDFTFTNESQLDKSFSIRYARQTQQLPKPPVEVKHHPSSVDDLLVGQLLSRSTSGSLSKFLRTDLSSVSSDLANRLCEELSSRTKGLMNGASKCSTIALDSKLVHQLTRLLQETTAIPPPNGACLSTAGEYNLRLGVTKEFDKSGSADLAVATASSKVGAYAGHPFSVECAVAVDVSGGAKSNLRQGVNVYRFANRIPLLFEKGNDVASVVSNQLIKWSQYKINPANDCVGVFVSLVSTKIPFKGASKDYVGSDILEIKNAVVDALRACCVQLRDRLASRHSERDEHRRIKGIQRYIPDIARSLRGVLDTTLENSSRESKSSSSKKFESDWTTKYQNATLEVLSEKLVRAVEASDAMLAQMGIADAGGASAGDGDLYDVMGADAKISAKRAVWFASNSSALNTADDVEELGWFQGYSSMRRASATS